MGGKIAAASSQESARNSAGICRLECNDGRAPAAGGFIALHEAAHGRRAPQVRVHRRAQHAGALAVDHADAVNAALPARGEIVVQQGGRVVDG